MSVPEIQGHTRLVGVFGWPVEHSLSPTMHNAAFAALALPFAYVPFAVEPDALGTALRALPALGVVGVNLTIPHKEAALPFLDAITPEARHVGAVNTIHQQDGRLLGDNTDGRGFWESLLQIGLCVNDRRVLVLGAGGAARSVTFRLVSEGARVVLVNRTRERAEQLAHAVNASGAGRHSVTVMDGTDTRRVTQILAEAVLLVQTTRVGMAPHHEALSELPLEASHLEALHSDLLVYDLIYTPQETALLREARQRGCHTLNGVKMLVYQGAAAFERWTGIWPPTDVMEQAVLAKLAP